MAQGFASGYCIYLNLHEPAGGVVLCYTWPVSSYRSDYFGVETQTRGAVCRPDRETLVIRAHSCSGPDISKVLVPAILEPNAIEPKINI